MDFGVIEYDYVPKHGGIVHLEDRKQIGTIYEVFGGISNFKVAVKLLESLNTSDYPINTKVFMKGDCFTHLVEYIPTSMNNNFLLTSEEAEISERKQMKKRKNTQAPETVTSSENIATCSDEQSHELHSGNQNLYYNPSYKEDLSQSYMQHITAFNNNESYCDNVESYKEYCPTLDIIREKYGIQVGDIKEESSSTKDDLPITNIASNNTSSRWMNTINSRFYQNVYSTQQGTPNDLSVSSAYNVRKTYVDTSNENEEPLYSNDFQASNEESSILSRWINEANNRSCSTYDQELTNVRESNTNADSSNEDEESLHSNDFQANNEESSILSRWINEANNRSCSTYDQELKNVYESNTNADASNEDEELLYTNDLSARTEQPSILSRWMNEANGTFYNNYDPLVKTVRENKTHAGASNEDEEPSYNNDFRASNEESTILARRVTEAKNTSYKNYDQLVQVVRETCKTPKNISNEDEETSYKKDIPAKNLLSHSRFTGEYNHFMNNIRNNYLSRQEMHKNHDTETRAMRNTVSRWGSPTKKRSYNENPVYKYNSNIASTSTSNTLTHLVNVSHCETNKNDNLLSSICENDIIQQDINDNPPKKKRKSRWDNATERRSYIEYEINNDNAYNSSPERNVRFVSVSRWDNEIHDRSFKEYDHFLNDKRRKYGIQSGKAQSGRDGSRKYGNNYRGRGRGYDYNFRGRNIRTEHNLRGRGFEPNFRGHGRGRGFEPDIRRHGYRFESNFRGNEHNLNEDDRGGYQRYSNNRFKGRRNHGYRSNY